MHNVVLGIFLLYRWLFTVAFTQPTSGVAGPLAAQGGGQICRPFVLGL